MMNCSMCVIHSSFVWDAKLHAIANNAWHGPRLLRLEHGLLEGSEQIKISGVSLRQPSTDTQITNRDYDTWMHLCMDTGWWWRCYAVDDVFLGHLRPHYPKAQSLTAVRYRNIVADQVLPFMATVFLAGDGHYQQDNVLCHNASIVKQQFKEHDGEFMLMP